MKLRYANPKKRHRGTMLIEVIAYMALFVVVLGMATEAFYQCWTSSKALRRDADRISRSLEVGERWRADVRQASGPIETTTANGSETFLIPQAQGEITYRFANAALRRKAAGNGKESVVLSNIKSSQMRVEPVAFGAVCRWELELVPMRLHQGALPALFSFTSVAATGKNP